MERTAVHVLHYLFPTTDVCVMCIIISDQSGEIRLGAIYATNAYCNIYILPRLVLYRNVRSVVYVIIINNNYTLPYTYFVRSARG